MSIRVIDITRHRVSGGGRTFLWPEVQHVRHNVANGIATTETFNVAAPVPGDLCLIGNINRGTALRQISSIAQTNVVWTLVRRIATSAGNAQIELWQGVVSASPGTSIVITYNGQLNLGAITNFIEFGQGGTLDQQNSANGAVSAMDTGSITTTVATEILVASFGNIAGTFIGGPTNGFELYDGVVTAATPNVQGAICFLRVTGTLTTSSGASSGANFWGAVIASFS